MDITLYLVDRSPEVPLSWEKLSYFAFHDPGSFGYFAGCLCIRICLMFFPDQGLREEDNRSKVPFSLCQGKSVFYLCIVFRTAVDLHLHHLVEILFVRLLHWKVLAFFPPFYTVLLGKKLLWIGSGKLCSSSLVWSIELIFWNVSACFYLFSLIYSLNHLFNIDTWVYICYCMLNTTLFFSSICSSFGYWKLL